MTAPQSAAQVIEAGLTWTGEGFEAGVQVEVTAGGRIGRVGHLGAGVTHRLARQALLPGFVNAHSHAFQRGLRGHGERFPAGAGSFWTWRAAMYELVERLDGARLLDLTRRCFEEMRAAGITTVGEFHYVRHDRDGDFAFDRPVIAAARAAGLRLVWLPTYYRTGGIAQPLGRGQRRFATPSPESYWAAFDALAGELDPRWATVGAVVHSVRAASLDDLAAIHAEAVRRGLVFHIHVEEQRREVEECLAAYGRTPLRALLERIGGATNVTAIHCTHSKPEDRADFLSRGGRICLCPLTEGNLGDGVPSLDGVPLEALCLGTDSNSRIDPTEDCRWLEYGQRLTREARGALADPEGQVARALLGVATAGGAAALGVPTGRVEPGAWADFQAIAIETPALQGLPPDLLLDGWLFGGSTEAVTATCVGGVWRHHRLAP